VVTRLLAQWRSGDEDAGNRLFAAVYQELRRLADWQLKSERGARTLQPTALVNELYIKLFAGAAVEWQDRAHFFAVAAQQFRRLLIDHARARQAEKRGGAAERVTLTDASVLPNQRDADLLDLDDALRLLENLDPRAARVVELRYFGGLDEKEASAVMGISLATLKRDWDFAKTWLFSRLRPV
jgi:RNA polymerase sigma-70 factor (ECF subfamily)